MQCSIYRPASARIRQSFCSHGLPGNEQNLDLARAMQRAGWAVITFHYRGSWGSGGKFTLSGGCADVDALLREIEGASSTDKWHVDPHRIVVVGMAPAARRLVRQPAPSGIGRDRADRAVGHQLRCARICKAFSKGGRRPRIRGVQ